MTDFRAREPYKACPLCGEEGFTELKVVSCRSHPLFQPPLPDLMRWCKCKDCDHVFTDGYFTKAAAEILFSRTLPEQDLGYRAEEQRSFAGRVVERVYARGVTGGAWLDIGFGNGALLFAARECGYEPVGIDLRQGVVAKLKALGIEAHHTDIERLSHPGRYAVISMADVLEHMPFPTVGLTAADRLLAPGGVLFISMPSYGAPVWDIMTLNGSNPYWGEIEHYHNFSRARLSALLREFGFEVVHFAISERYRLGMEIIARRTEAV